MLELRNRSANRRESAAIWIGLLDGSRSVVKQVRFYHHLCDDAAAPAFLELSEEAKFALYAELAPLGLKLIGTIHTHPRAWVGLSDVDESNQLCSRTGFWAFVVPYYAKKPWDVLKTGVHIRVNSGWYEFSAREAATRIVVHE